MFERQIQRDVCWRHDCLDLHSCWATSSFWLTQSQGHGLYVRYIIQHQVLLHPNDQISGDIAKWNVFIYLLGWRRRDGIVTESWQWALKRNCQQSYDQSWERHGSQSIIRSLNANKNPNVINLKRGRFNIYSPKNKKKIVTLRSFQHNRMFDRQG